MVNLLLFLNAPPRLAAHHRLVADVSVQLATALRRAWPGLHANRLAGREELPPTVWRSRLIWSLRRGVAKPFPQRIDPDHGAILAATRGLPPSSVGEQLDGLAIARQDLRPEAAADLIRAELSTGKRSATALNRSGSARRAASSHRCAGLRRWPAWSGPSAGVTLSRARRLC